MRDYKAEMNISIPYYDDNTRVSNSSLGWFLISPRYYRQKLDGEVIDKTSSAMENGQMVHMYLLQKDEFKYNYKILDVVTPSSQQQKQFCADYIKSEANKPILKAVEAFKANYSTSGKTDDDIGKKGLEMALKLKSYIKWLRAGDNSKKKIISWSDLNSLKITRENVQLHIKANELLFNQEDSEDIEYLNEFQINWEYKLSENVILPCKSLIDRLIINHRDKKITLVDIKTTASVSNFSKSFNDYDYGRQMAYYWMAIVWLFKNILKIDIDEYEAETFIVAVQNNGSYECRVFKVSENVLLQKAAEIKQIMTNLQWHMSNNKWEHTKEYYENNGVESLEYNV